MDNFPKFPTGKERKDGVAKSQEEVDKLIAMRGEYPPWAIIDSGLDKASSTSRYPVSMKFIDVIPSRFSTLRAYIEDTLSEKKGEAIGVEFGGTGSALFAEFTPGFFRKTIGVSVMDHRQVLDRTLAEKDLARNHVVLEADLLRPGTYTELEQLLEGKGADLILERMYGGLDLLPDEPILLADILRRWYACLNEGGLLFAQVPRQFNSTFMPWVEEIHAAYADTLELEADYPKMALRLYKKKGAPEELPLLPVKDVKDANRF